MEHLRIFNCKHTKTLTCQIGKWEVPSLTFTQPLVSLHLIQRSFLNFFLSSWVVKTTALWRMHKMLINPKTIHFYCWTVTLRRQNVVETDHRTTRNSKSRTGPQGKAGLRPRTPQTRAVQPPHPAAPGQEHGSDSNGSYRRSAATRPESRARDSM